MVVTPKHGKRMVVGLIVLLTLTMLSFAGYRLLDFFRQPAEGMVVVMASNKQTPVTALEYKQFDGRYFSLALPETFQRKPQQQGQATGLENHSFTARKQPAASLLLTVMPLPDGGLDSDASYILRKKNPEQYQVELIALKGGQVALARTVGEQTHIAFWPHQKYLLIMTLNGVLEDEPTTDKAFRRIVESVTWK